MRSALISIGLLATVASVAAAATFVVAPDGTGDFPTIQDALTSAANGDIIELTDGTFTGDGNRDLDYLGKSVTVRSQSDDATVCIIDCGGASDDPHRGVIFQNNETSDAVLQGVTIFRGIMEETDSGGGILCLGAASPRILGCIVTGCFAGIGGGIACLDEASPLIDECELSGNFAAGGGGLACLSESSAAIQRSIIIGNNADQMFGGGLGGGIYAPHQAVLLILDCAIEENSATGNFAGTGGGIFAGPNVDIERCTIAGNRADSAGGVQGSPEITDSVIVGNSAVPGLGGGLQGAPTLVRCTVAGNNSLSSGGGIHATDTTVLQQTIVWGNCTVAGNGGEIFYSGLIQIDCSDVDATGVEGTGTLAYGPDMLFVDPQFCMPEDCQSAPTTAGVYQLSESSPCLPVASPCGLLIGALGVGCGPTPVGETTWSLLKDRFR